MVELLVVMILAGVVFLSMMEGVGLFGRHAARTWQRIEENSRFYGNFCRLEELVAQADSLIATAGEDGVDIYRGGALRATVAGRDSCLVVAILLTDSAMPGWDFDPAPDTLLTNVAAMAMAPNRRNPMRIDTLKLLLTARDGATVTATFPAAQHPLEKAAIEIKEIENRYIYE